jgi:phospholipid/cholesterol/gamma-HCH transport system substrate-binding protein
MNRRTVLAQLAVFGVISVAIIAYTVFNLLGVSVTNRPFHVSVQLSTGGGIFDGAEVAYRGVEVGRVSDVHLGTNGVTLTLAIDKGKQIPTNAIAHIYDLSAAGEQYVDLVPTAPSTHYLHGGSVIAAKQTTTPLPISAVLYDVERFVDSLDPEDLRILGTEGANAFSGTGPQLKSILADSTTILQQLAQTQDQTVRLLANSALLLHSAAAHSSGFDQFAASLRALTGTLASSTPTIETLLQQSAPTTELVNNLIRDNGSAIGVLLGNLATLSNIQVARVPGLKSLLVAVPEFGRTAPLIANGDALTGVLNFNAHTALCPSGVPLTNPISGTRSKLYAISCNGLPRGASNAPPPVGGTGTSAITSARLTPGGSTQVGTFDPLSGLVSTADGTQLRLGSDGGEEQMLGAQSWEALLLPGAGR